MLRGYRFSMIDEMKNREYIELYGAAGDAFSEVIDEAPYEMAVLSNLIIYLTKMMRKQESENRGDGAFGREARTEKDPACSPKDRTKQLPRPVDNVSVFESDTVEARQGEER